MGRTTPEKELMLSSKLKHKILPPPKYPEPPLYGWAQYDEAIWDTECSKDLVIYEQCDITNNDPEYWSTHFPDLQDSQMRRNKRAVRSFIDKNLDTWVADCAHLVDRIKCGEAGGTPTKVCSDPKKGWCHKDTGLCTIVDDTADVELQWSNSTWLANTHADHPKRTCLYIYETFLDPGL